MKDKILGSLSQPSYYTYNSVKFTFTAYLTYIINIFDALFELKRPRLESAIILSDLSLLP